jgi:hypothetical protein
VGLVEIIEIPKASALSEIGNNPTNASYEGSNCFSLHFVYIH